MMNENIVIKYNVGPLKRDRLMSKYALLLRLNPARWPVWESHVITHPYAKVWFKTGRRRIDDIHPGIPVVVLGTNSLGLVACGETVTGVEFLSDPDW
jgi:hypothetical protein